MTLAVDRAVNPQHKQTNSNVDLLDNQQKANSHGDENSSSY